MFFYRKTDVLEGVYNVVSLYHSDKPESERIKKFIDHCINIDKHRFDTPKDIFDAIKWYLRKEDGKKSDTQVADEAARLMNNEFPDEYRRLFPYEPTSIKKDEFDRIEYPLQLPLTPQKVVQKEEQDNTTPPKSIDTIIDTKIRSDGVYVNMDQPDHIRTPGAHIQSGPVIYAGPSTLVQPVHKVDTPTPPPKPASTVDKSVDVDLSKINIPINVETKKRAPDFIQRFIPRPAPPVPSTVSHDTIVKNIYDNSIMIKKYPKAHLKDIEKIANSCGYSVYMAEWLNNGIIAVIAVYGDSKIVPDKSFVIDTGMIIDRRVKLIKHNFYQSSILELDPMFELFTGINGGSGKTIDIKLLKTIFEYGIDSISKNEMYKLEKKELNLKVALITVPTTNVSQRKTIEAYLAKMDQEGWFDKARQYSPGARFVFIPRTKLDPKDLTSFTLINEGVPAFYGGPVPQQVPLIIKSSKKGVSIHAGQK